MKYIQINYSRKSASKFQVAFDLKEVFSLPSEKIFELLNLEALLNQSQLPRIMFRKRANYIEIEFFVK